MWGPVIVAIALFVVGLLYFEKKNGSKNVGIPRVPGIPVFGTLIDTILNKEKLHDYYLAQHAKYGPIIYHRMLNRHFVLVTAPEDVKHILQTNFNNYPKGPWFQEILHDFLGEGIFNSDGESWRVQRKEASTLFHFENLTSSVLATFVQRAEACTKVFKKHLESKKPLDVQDIFLRYTMDSIAEIGFGYPINSVENTSNASGELDFVAAFDYVNEGSMQRVVNHPLWKILQHKGTEFHRQVKTLNNFILKIIDSRRKELATKPRETIPNDLLSIFLKQDTSGHFSDTYLLDVVKNFMIAGRDTTAVCLTWTCYWLSQNPEVEKKLRQEIDRVFPNFDKNAKLTDVITNEKLSELKYMRNVIDECLRLSPPVPLDQKYCLEDDTLPSGYTVSKASQVGYPIYSIHRDPNLWTEPNKFNPDRWTTDTIKPYQFVAFNAGPRVCLGTAMAYLEVKVLLTALLLNYELSLVEGHDASYKMSITLFAKHGMPMYVRQH